MHFQSFRPEMGISAMTCIQTIFPSRLLQQILLKMVPTLMFSGEYSKKEQLEGEEKAELSARPRDLVQAPFLKSH